jgi:hypothetical protein
VLNHADVSLLPAFAERLVASVWAAADATRLATMSPVKADEYAKVSKPGGLRQNSIMDFPS